MTPRREPAARRETRPALAWRAAALGAIGVLVVIGLGLLAVVETGAFDVAASVPHAYPVAWATHTTMIHSAKLRAHGIEAPARFTADEVRAGAVLYEANCAMCHGGPAEARAPMTAGMNPTPPYLLDAGRKWSSPELYWIVDNGVKMTGMPAWRGVLSDRQIWSIVAFLDALPGMSPEVYRQMRRTATAQAGTPGRPESGAPYLAAPGQKPERRPLQPSAKPSR